MVSPLRPVAADGGSELAMGPGILRSERLRRGRRSWSVAVRSEVEVDGLLGCRFSAEGALREDVRLGMGRLDEFVLVLSRAWSNFKRKMSVRLGGVGQAVDNAAVQRTQTRSEGVERITRLDVPVWSGLRGDALKEVGANAE
jgi:hypothetical protein